MVILQEYLDKTRDLIHDNVTQAQAGTGTTLPAKTDTGLETAIAGTKVTVTKTKSSNPATIQFTMALNTAQGNGNDLTEWELLNGDDVSVHRTVTASLSKTSTISVTRIITLEVNDE